MNKKHRWVTMGVWHVSEEEVQKVELGQSLTISRPPDMVNGPGCFDCETHYMSEDRTDVCEAPEAAEL